MMKRERKTNESSQASNHIFGEEKYKQCSMGSNVPIKTCLPAAVNLESMGISIPDLATSAVVIYAGEMNEEKGE